MSNDDKKAEEAIEEAVEETIEKASEEVSTDAQISDRVQQIIEEKWANFQTSLQAQQLEQKQMIVDMEARLMERLTPLASNQPSQSENEEDHQKTPELQIKKRRRTRLKNRR